MSYKPDGPPGFLKNTSSLFLGDVMLLLARLVSRILRHVIIIISHFNYPEMESVSQFMSSLLQHCRQHVSFFIGV